MQSCNVEFTMPETILTIPHSASLHHPCPRAGHGPFGLCQLCIHQSSSIRHQQDAESAKCSNQVCVKPKEDGQQYGSPKNATLAAH